MPAIGAEFAPICTISAGNWCISPKRCAACARAPRGRVVAGGRHKSLAPFCRLAAAPVGASLSSGLDRIIMVLSQTDNIRDVIAFPKTQKASDLMMQCPAPVAPKQLKELKIEAEATEISWN